MYSRQPEIVGDINLLEMRKVAFLSSIGSTEGCADAIRCWVDSLSAQKESAQRVCVLMGCMQKIEIEILNELLRREIPVILVMPDHFPDMWHHNQVQAIGNRLLTVLSLYDRRPCDAEPAEYRNLFIISFADEIVVGMLNPNGKLARQLEGKSNVRVLGQYKPKY